MKEKNLMIYNSKSNNRKSRIEIVMVIFMASISILIPIYLLFKNYSIKDSEIKSLRVTLSKTPEYYEYIIKSSRYTDIIFYTNEFRIPFRITNWSYKATSHIKFQKSVSKGDEITLIVDKEDFIGQSSEKYIEVYQVKKDNLNFVDLTLREELIKSDSKWGICFIILGICMLLPIISKKVSVENIERLIFILSIITLFILVFINIFT